MLGLPVITFVSKAKKMWEKHPSHPIKRYLELKVWYTPGGGVLLEKLGRGVRPASQNPYPIYDKNLRFSLPYL